VIRKAEISEQTFYRWKAKYAGLEVDQVRQTAQLQEENLRLKLVAELTQKIGQATYMLIESIRSVAHGAL
jgi:hypothetical protein